MARYELRRRSLLIAAAGYGLLMLWLLFFQRTSQAARMDLETYLHTYTNLVPFQTVRLFWRVLRHGEEYASWLPWHAFVNLGGNILMFVPLGIFLPLLFPKQRHWGHFLLTVFMLILCVELLQLATMLGSCDIDDLILNVIGASLGFFLWKHTPLHRLL